MADDPRADLLQRAVETCIKPDDAAIDAIDQLFTDDVIVWSPNLFTKGIDELATSLAFREASFSDVNIYFHSVVVAGTKGFAEFRVCATFSGPFVVDDENIMEPNNKELQLGAAVICDFDAGTTTMTSTATTKISGLRAYFDDFSLLEQMLPA